MEAPGSRGHVDAYTEARFNELVTVPANDEVRPDTNEQHLDEALRQAEVLVPPSACLPIDDKKVGMLTQPAATPRGIARTLVVIYDSDNKIRFASVEHPRYDALAGGDPVRQRIAYSADWGGIFALYKDGNPEPVTVARSNELGYGGGVDVFLRETLRMGISDVY